ncbi:hypothetical protein ID853_07955, partial [Xenorhabdus sp. Vera]|uniref:hypothetical protein n=1 Tax=Xenorhabdus koppenhoeferi TaxID=351659 RepID=UPI001988CBB3
MLRMPPSQTFPPETFSLDDLVPKNHLVRKVDAALDFEFIRDLVAPQGKSMSAHFSPKAVKP